MYCLATEKKENNDSFRQYIEYYTYRHLGIWTFGNVSQLMSLNKDVIHESLRFGKLKNKISFHQCNANVA